MPNFSPYRYCAGKINPGLLAGLLAAAVAIVAAVYFLRPQTAPEPVPPPMRSTPLETVAPAQSAQERGDNGREIIARLRADPAGVDYAMAHQSATEFRAAGNLADAQLLYFFAARGGHGPARFELATMYDPNQFSAGTSLMDAADPAQAYKWYRAALDSGEAQAGERLGQLRSWAESAAASGDAAAERLLLQWEGSEQ